MATKKQREPSPPAASDAQIVVHLFRMITDQQFDFWIMSMNNAVAAMGGDEQAFTRDDRQKTISYWYILMSLLEMYAANRDPFAAKAGETWLSDGLVSMSQLSRDFKDRYKEETVRRYVFDLKRYGLIALKGRGPEALVQLTAPAILALTNTIRHWIAAFREVDERIKGMGVA